MKLSKGIKSIFIGMSFLMCSLEVANAGGVGLGATRLIYNEGAKQISIAVRNTDAKGAFLLQSWIENYKGVKTEDFMITPPLNVIKPASENVLKIIQIENNLPKDRESVYWLTVKAIPGAYEKKNTNDNVLQIASASRIKIFWRPKGLNVKSENAHTMLSVSKKNNDVVLTNSSPYYLSLVEVKVGHRAMNPVMVPPKESVNLGGIQGNSISFQTVNDYGARTKIQSLNW